MDSADDEPDSGVLKLGNITVNLLTFQTAVDGVPVELTIHEHDLLVVLIRNAGRVLIYSELTTTLWDDTGLGKNRHLNVLIHRLRNKIKASSPYRIETVRGRGYGLLAPREGRIRAESDQQPFPRAGPAGSPGRAPMTSPL